MLTRFIRRGQTRNLLTMPSQATVGDDKFRKLPSTAIEGGSVSSEAGTASEDIHDKLIMSEPKTKKSQVKLFALSELDSVVCGIYTELPQ